MSSHQWLRDIRAGAERLCRGDGKLADSTLSDGGRCASFFFLDAYDGHDVQNALTVTERRNSGQGLAMTIEDYSRPVPAQEAVFHLKGRTHCAAPIIEPSRTAARPMQVARHSITACHSHPETRNRAT